MLLATLAACGNEPPSVAPIAVDKVVAKVWTTERGITMAVGDSYQLHASAIGLNGQSIPVDTGTAGFQFSTADTSYIHIASDGTIQAIKETDAFSPARVVVSLRAGGANRADSIYVVVTATRQQVAAVNIHPAPGDSTRAAVYSAIFLTPSALDSSGNAVPGIYVAVWSNPEQVLIDPFYYLMFTFVPGKQWVYASATAYGQTYRDSVQYEFLYPASSDLYIGPAVSGTGIALSPAVEGRAVIVQPCGVVTWYNNTSDALDLVFDDPSKTGVCTPGDATGNALNIAPGASVSRKVPAVGTLNYTLARSATPATILVRSAIQTQ